MSPYGWARALLLMTRVTRWQVTIALVAPFLSLGIAAQGAPQPTTSVTVAGNVAQSLSLSVVDLKRYPTHQVDYVSRNTVEEKGTAPARHYTGCLLRDVLAAAKPVESKPRELRKSYVVATASDGYEVVFSWAELFVSPMGDSVLVVYERDGAPLPDDEGPIALIVVADMRPVRHVKWLRSLTLRSA
jgi:DMSO/TMAO reductase YedYZ molybdopterin-dependent catalytic subunit